MRQILSSKSVLIGLGLFLAVGCIFTVTYVATELLVSSNSPLTITDADFAVGKRVVDFTGEEDFEENRDKIESIDNLGFYLSITNHSATDIEYQLFLEEDTSLDWISVDSMVEHGVPLIFTGLIIPAGEHVVVDWGESIRYITGLDEIKRIVERGYFSLYPAAIPRESFEMTIDSMVAVITFTGG